MTKLPLNLTTNQIALLYLIIGRVTLSSAPSSTQEDMHDIFDQISEVLKLKPTFVASQVFETSPKFLATVAQSVSGIIQATAYAAPFEGKSLPKGIWYFKYPAQGTGELVERWVKVEKKGPHLIHGYEIDASGAMTWSFKTFDVRKMVGQQISE